MGNLSILSVRGSEMNPTEYASMHLNCDDTEIRTWRGMIAVASQAHDYDEAVEMLAAELRITYRPKWHDACSLSEYLGRVAVEGVDWRQVARDMLTKETEK